MENEKFPSSTIELIEMQLKRHEKSIDDLREQIRLCQIDNATVNAEIKQVLQGITELKDSVSELKEKPSKKWDTVVTTIITSLITGIMGIIIGVFFGK